MVYIGRVTANNVQGRVSQCPPFSLRKPRRGVLVPEIQCRGAKGRDKPIRAVRGADSPALLYYLPPLKGGSKVMLHLGCFGLALRGAKHP
jgi:hypothetical protein